jgi:hypothetical protein
MPRTWTVTPRSADSGPLKTFNPEKPAEILMNTIPAETASGEGHNVVPRDTDDIRHETRGGSIPIPPRPKREGSAQLSNQSDGATQAANPS